MKTYPDIRLDLPATSASYLEQLALLHYGSLSEEYEDMIRKFIKVAPWSAWPPLDWRKPPITTPFGAVRITVPATTDLHECMDDTIDQINTINRHTLDFPRITKQVFVYTAIVWWITYVYPQASYHEPM